jgi:hypothetical protein
MANALTSSNNFSYSLQPSQAGAAQPGTSWPGKRAGQTTWPGQLDQMGFGAPSAPGSDGQQLAQLMGGSSGQPGTAQTQPSISSGGQQPGAGAQLGIYNGGVHPGGGNVSGVASALPPPGAGPGGPDGSAPGFSGAYNPGQAGGAGSAGNWQDVDTPSMGRVMGEPYPNALTNPAAQLQPSMGRPQMPPGLDYLSKQPNLKDALAPTMARYTEYMRDQAGNAMQPGGATRPPNWGNANAQLMPAGPGGWAK